MSEVKSNRAWRLECEELRSRLADIESQNRVMWDVANDREARLAEAEALLRGTEGYPMPWDWLERRDAFLAADSASVRHMTPAERQMVEAAFDRSCTVIDAGIDATSASVCPFQGPEKSDYTPTLCPVCNNDFRKCAEIRAAFQPSVVLTNPWTGEPRDIRDVESDPAGLLMVEPGKPLLAAVQPGVTNGD
jgi:hypothetical protein